MADRAVVRELYQEALLAMHPSGNPETVSEALDQAFDHYASCYDDWLLAATQLSRAKAPVEAEFRRQTQSNLDEARKAARPIFEKFEPLFDAAQTDPERAAVNEQWKAAMAPVNQKFESNTAPQREAADLAVASFAAAARLAETRFKAASDLLLQALVTGGPLPSLDLISFQADVQSSKVPVVADFWADWCAPCRALAPVLEKVVEDMTCDVRLIKVDVDVRKDVANHYQVMGIPQLLIFVDGQLSGRSSNTRTPHGLRSLFDSAIAGELQVGDYIIDPNGPFKRGTALQ